MNRAAAAAFAAVACSVGMFAAAPTASASPSAVAPGDAVAIGTRTCTVGFIGTNASERKLAVTAGHCSHGVGESVRDKVGNHIGKVIAHAGDPTKAAGPFGATVILLSKGVKIAPTVRRIGTPSRGTAVAQLGGVTPNSRGTVTVTRSDVLRSTAKGKPGDSGSPWIDARTGTLYGITVGGSERGTYAAPIHAVVKRIRAVFPSVGNGFRVVGASTKGSST